jgi:hypothetical protein
VTTRKANRKAQEGRQGSTGDRWASNSLLGDSRTNLLSHYKAEYVVALRVPKQSTETLLQPWDC